MRRVNRRRGVTAQRRARWRKAVEAGCQDTWAREVAKSVEAGSRRQETVDGGREPVKVDEEGDPARRSWKGESVRGV